MNELKIEYLIDIILESYILKYYIKYWEYMIDVKIYK